MSTRVLFVAMLACGAHAIWAQRLTDMDRLQRSNVAMSRPNVGVGWTSYDPNVFKDWGGTFVPATVEEIAAAGALLSKMSLTTPRLIATQQRFDQLKAQVTTDPTLSSYHTFLRNRADNMKTAPLAQYRNDDGILHEARYALDTILTTAYAYKVTGDVTYFDRAKAELMNIVSWPDWRPQVNHFLYVSELTAAAALGMDWLSDRLTPSEMQTVRTAIVNKALNPALLQYRSADRIHWWLWSGLNVDIVSNCGLILGALAVNDQYGPVASEVLAHAFKSLAIGIESFADDGGWIEGVGYWEYGMTYLAMACDALTTALGDDNGLTARAGLDRTGEFKLFSGGLSNKVFNFAETYDYNDAVPVLFWLSKKYNRPEFAYYQRSRIVVHRPQPLDMIWYDSRGTAQDLAALPKSRFFANVHQTFLRSSWTDSDAISVAFKGGDNGANHNHHDMGHFIMDALGERWAIDLGWTAGQPPINDYRQYYRWKTEGHNTMTFGGDGQDPIARGNIMAFGTDANRPYAIAKMDSGVPNRVSVWRRGVKIVDNKYVTIQDEWRCKSTVTTQWSMHTLADVAIQGREATLTQNGKVLKVVIRSPRTATFILDSPNIVPPETWVPGLKKLAIRVKGRPTVNRLTVVLIPQRPGAPSAITVRVRSLLEWQLNGSLP